MTGEELRKVYADAEAAAMADGASWTAAQDAALSAVQDAVRRECAAVCDVVYDQSDKDLHGSMFRQGWEAAAERFEQTILALCEKP